MPRIVQEALELGWEDHDGNYTKLQMVSSPQEAMRVVDRMEKVFNDNEDRILAGAKVPGAWPEGYNAILKDTATGKTYLYADDWEEV